MSRHPFCSCTERTIHRLLLLQHSCKNKNTKNTVRGWFRVAFLMLSYLFEVISEVGSVKVTFTFNILPPHPTFHIGETWSRRNKDLCLLSNLFLSFLKKHSISSSFSASAARRAIIKPVQINAYACMYFFCWLNLRETGHSLCLHPLPYVFMWGQQR